MVRDCKGNDIVYRMVVGNRPGKVRCGAVRYDQTWVTPEPHRVKAVRAVVRARNRVGGSVTTKKERQIRDDGQYFSVGTDHEPLLRHFSHRNGCSR